MINATAKICASLIFLVIFQDSAKAEGMTSSRAANLCNALAADPIDRNAMAGYPGVAEIDITAAAVGACRVATQRSPDDARLHYLLGRASLARSDFDTAISELKTSASGDYAAAERTLGEVFAQGRGVAKDPALALQHYERAAELGDPVGLMSAVKVMIVQKAPLGPIVDLLTRAGLAGSADAWTLLGKIDAEEADAPHDAIETALLNGLAKDSDEASLQLARLYDRRGNQTAMVAIYEQLAALNNSEAMFELSKHAEGAVAETWLERASEAGSAEAMYRLSVNYRDGADGQNQDQALATQWLTKAANAGLPIAMSDLGYVYLYTEPVDYRLAQKWFEAAAEKEDAGGFLGLAYMFEEGDGVDPDTEKALSMYTSAIAAGDAKYARFYRARIEDKPGSLRAVDQAAEDIMLSDPSGPVSKSVDAGLKEFSVETRMALQLRLKAQGQNVQIADGVFGPASIRALKAYWASR